MLAYLHPPLPGLEAWLLLHGTQNVEQRQQGDSCPQLPHLQGLRSHPTHPRSTTMNAYFLCSPVPDRHRVTHF